MTMKSSYLFLPVFQSLFLHTGDFRKSMGSENREETAICTQKSYKFYDNIDVEMIIFLFS